MLGRGAIIRQEPSVGCAICTMPVTAASDLRAALRRLAEARELADGGHAPDPRSRAISALVREAEILVARAHG
ncbi:MAG: hypothetical protein U1C74_32735 [Phenylobacterium sp.]|nr:hypothetical protein [Phenylobacterium sp.]